MAPALYRQLCASVPFDFLFSREMISQCYHFFPQLAPGRVYSGSSRISMAWHMQMVCRQVDKRESGHNESKISTGLWAACPRLSTSAPSPSAVCYDRATIIL